MYTTSLNILSKVQDVEVSTEEISGSFDGLNSNLSVKVNFRFRVPDGYNGMYINTILAALYLSDINTQLSEVQLPVPLLIDKPEYSRKHTFQFKLTEKALSLIERQRQGDVNLAINIQLGANILVRISSMYQLKLVEECHNKLSFSIPKSIWVESMLPQLGYGSFKLVEIPLAHSFLKEAYDNIIDEFDKAETYFNQQDYDKCIAHCRHTMDALNRNLKKIRDGMSSESAFKWLKNIDEATYDWIDKVSKANSAITSKAHHSGHKTSFTKYEAESIYLTTVSLMNIVGHLSSK